MPPVFKKIKTVIIFVLLTGIISVSFYLTIKKGESDRELKSMIGQMLILGFRGTEAGADSYIAKAIKNLNLGGVILFDYDVPSKSFPRNIINPEQAKKLAGDLKSFSLSPLLVAVDAEGGYVNRLKEKYGFLLMPSAQELGEKNDIEETKKTALSLAKELSETGFNMNFAPVVDVNINPENPVIGKIERSFSDDPLRVTEQAAAFIEAHHNYNILTAIKHFPGHGSSMADSHKGMTDITNTYEEKELIPFQELIKKGIVDAVMTAHIINKNIDENYPATLSPLFIKNILREKLEFEGVVISDDMQMGAIADNYGFEESVIRAINAGCDMLIISNNNNIYDESIPYKASNVIFKAVKEGRISFERITESFYHITELKKKLVY